MGVLSDKKMILGITGGIAAYKAAFLARELGRRGADVHCILTETAERFVTPLTLSALTGNRCWTNADMFSQNPGVPHVELARDCDLIVVAPCTATTLARLAQGFADTLLSAVVLAGRGPVVLSPAMHTEMWQAKTVQENLSKLLRDNRYSMVEPESGELASKDNGTGRFPDVVHIVEAAMAALTPQDLKGKTVVVTAGPTRERIDPVRVLTNPSTGTMGIAMARALLRRGAGVVLVAGPVSAPLPRRLTTAGLETRLVETTVEMLNAVEAAIDDSDALVMAAAPADERPVRMADGKIHKEDLPRTLELEPTPDIIRTVLGRVGPRFKSMAFAAETRDVETSGRRKLESKRATMLFANPVGPQLGFGDGSNSGTLLYSDGRSETFGVMEKEELAVALVDRLARAITGDDTRGN